jgi:hypothetical protein
MLLAHLKATPLPGAAAAGAAGGGRASTRAKAEESDSN